MCNQFTFHHPFGIDTWRSKFEQQTDSIGSACGSHGPNHKDPDTIDLNAPRLAQHMHYAWKTHQNTVYWDDINFDLKKGLKFYQTRWNAIILHETLIHCFPKVVRSNKPNPNPDDDRTETPVVFRDWFRRSRTTQIDMLFNEIHNKTKPTTRSVRSHQSG